jgi:hypothetical protein
MTYFSFVQIYIFLGNLTVRMERNTIFYLLNKRVFPNLFLLKHRIILIFLEQVKKLKIPKNWHNLFLIFKT